MSRLRLAGPVALVLALVAPFAAAANSRGRVAPVPQGFAGVVLGAPIFPDSDPTVDVNGQLDMMVASGVQSLRVAIDWASTQPYRSWAKVPPEAQSQFVDVGGIPTRLAPIEQLVDGAAQRGLTVVPTVLNAPSWDGDFRRGALVSIPRSDGPYASFLGALVHRFGPHGSFWQTHSPKVPIRMWQIWNEPNITPFWPVQPFERRYVALLRAAHGAIKRADPGAKVVLAGLPNFSWVALQRLYKITGARGQFDVVAAHPYTKAPQGVISILGKVRQVMNSAGDARKPILADEVSWPSSLGKTNHNVGFDFATTEAGQARNVGQLLALLGRNRLSLGLLGFYYYTWAGTEHRNALAFDFSGLLRFNSSGFVAKPALTAYRRGALALERCRRRGATATVCLQSY